MPRQVRRTFDHEAYEAIVNQVLTKGPLTLEFADPGQATYQRQTFYRWRLQEQAIIPGYAAGITIQTEGNKLTFINGNSSVRDALAAVGIKVEERPLLQPETPAVKPEPTPEPAQAPAGDASMNAVKNLFGQKEDKQP